MLRWSQWRPAHHLRITQQQVLAQGLFAHTFERACNKGAGWVTSAAMASRTWLRRRPTTSANLVPSVAGDSDGTHEPEKLPCRLDSHESRLFVFCLVTHIV